MKGARMGGKVRTKNQDGARVYEQQDTGLTVPGVSSIKDMIPKPWLARWQANMAADAAIDAINDGWFNSMAKSSRKGARQFLGGSADRSSGLRADIGSAAHTMFEILMNGDPRPSVADAIRDNDRIDHLLKDQDALDEVDAMTDQFEDFLQEVQPVLFRAEDTAWSDTHGYAGSFDIMWYIKVNPETLKVDLENGEEVLLMGDYKTGKKIYADVALQLAAYEHADRIIDPEGNSIPMPELAGSTVLHVTATQWNLRSIRTDEEVFNMFLACRAFLPAVIKWARKGYKESLENNVIGKQMAKSSRRQTGTERRAA